MTSWLLPIKQQFTLLIDQQRLPHALIFQGVVGSGKKALSDWLVHLLLCQQPLKQPDHVNYGCGVCKSCLLFKNNSYPDHKVLLSDKATLGVDDIRGANSFLEKTAFFGAEGRSNASTTTNTSYIKQAKKTVIIENAEKMTTAAANALLKTLEEPSDNSLIILLTNDIDSLLPTIISRCRIINIKPENSEEFSEAKKNIDPFANASQWPELNDKAVREQYTDFLTKLVNYLRSQQDFDSIVTLFVNNQYAYRWFEKVITNIMRQQQQWLIAPLALSSANIYWLQQINAQTLWQIYQLLLQTNKQFKLLPQANKQFIIEKLLINCLSLLNSN